MSAFFQRIVAFFMAVLAFFGLGRMTGKTPVEGGEVKGKTVEFTLKSNPSTGYSWEVDIDGDSVVLTDKRYEAPKTAPNVAGAPGYEHFTFSAVRPGRAVIRFSYLRSWETEPPVETVTAVVEVDSGLDIAILSYE